MRTGDSIIRSFVVLLGLLVICTNGLKINGYRIDLFPKKGYAAVYTKVWIPAGPSVKLSHRIRYVPLTWIKTIEETK